MGGGGSRFNLLRHSTVGLCRQPLTVAVLASLFFGERLGPKAVVGLALGVLGIGLVEVCAGARGWSRDWSEGLPRYAGGKGVCWAAFPIICTADGTEPVCG